MPNVRVNWGKVDSSSLPKELFRRQIEALLKLAKEIKDESKFQEVIQFIFTNFTPVCPSVTLQRILLHNSKSPRGSNSMQGCRNVYGRTDWSGQSFGQIIS